MCLKTSAAKILAQKRTSALKHTVEINTQPT